MFLADYHTHSRCSPDGVDSVTAMAEAAYRAGLREIAVTDHCDMARAFDTEGHRESTMAAREALEDRVRVVYGIELGEATHDPKRAAAIVRDTPYDFVLGSYHQLKGGRDFYHQVYSDAEHCYTQIKRYLNELLELCATDCFDVLGHMTYPLRYIRREPILMHVSFQPFEERCRAVFRALIDSGRGIELNVSGLYRDDSDAMPDLKLLKLYREMGGEIVTIGSDAHSAKDVGRGICEGQALLREAGFRYMTCYLERRPRFERLD